jgi:hypothetical protein
MTGKAYNQGPKALVRMLNDSYYSQSYEGSSRARPGRVSGNGPIRRPDGAWGLDFTANSSLSELYQSFECLSRNSRGQESTANERSAIIFKFTEPAGDACDRRSKFALVWFDIPSNLSSEFGSEIAMDRLVPLVQPIDRPLLLQLPL